jgi:quinol monooxygenase YgiN/heme-degrading monooxygenase HmoA
MKLTNFLFLGGIVFLLSSCNQAPQQEAEADPLAGLTPYKAGMISHSVADYDIWKAAYMAHDSVRTAHGLTEISVGRAMDDPNSVMVLSRIEDLQKAKDFIAMPELKTTMDSAGVISAPVFSFMEVIRYDTTDATTNDRVMVSHKVKDFDAWFKVYSDEGRSTRASHGLVERGMARDLDDSNLVYIVFALTDMEKAKARMASEELKAIMTEAGVEGPPNIVFYTIDN